MSCLICTKQTGALGQLNVFEDLGSSSSPKDSTKHAVSGDLSAIFVVRKLLGISSEFCEYLIFSKGNPSSWGLQFCILCQSIIQEAHLISERIHSLVNEFDGICKRLKEVALTSIPRNDPAKKIRGGFRDVISEEIRAWFYEHAKEDGTSQSRNVPASLLPSTDNDYNNVEERKSRGAIINELSDQSDSETDQAYQDEEDVFQFIDGTDGTVPSVPSPRKCGKLFGSIFMAKVHVNRHHEGDPSSLDCEHCDRKFFRSHNLSRHISRMHSEINKDEEVLCNRTERGKRDISVQSFDTKPIPDAAEAEEIKSRLRGSVRTVKRKLLDQSDSDQADLDEFECPMSPAGPEWQEDLESSNSDSNEQDIGPEDEDIPSSKTSRSVKSKNVREKVYQRRQRKFNQAYSQKCSECDKSFQTQYLLEAHILRGHYDYQSPFSCDMCDKRFERVVRLHIHQRRFHPGLFFPTNLPTNTAVDEGNVAAENLEELASEATDGNINVVEIADGNTNLVEATSSEVTVDNIETKEDLEMLEMLQENGSAPCEHPLQLKGHTNVLHRGIKDGFKCPKCPKTFRKYNSLYSHCQSHLLNVSFTRCTHPGCNKSFKSKIGRDAHEQAIHLGVKNAYKCPNCPKRFSHSGSLYNHTRLTHKCAMDDFIQQPEAEEDLRTQKPNPSPVSFECSKCQLKFSCRLSIEVHLHRNHSDSEMEYSITCIQCQETFLTEETFQGHALSIHTSFPERRVKILANNEDWDDDLQSEPVIIPQRVINPDKTFMCEFCSKSFSQKRNLSHHQQSKHYKDLGLNPFKCKYCERIMANPKTLDNHIKLVHLKQYKFKCKFCPVGFMFQYQLDEHTLTHTGEKSLECPHCPKTFARKLYLKQHLILHKGIKPWVCNVCQQSFTTSSTFRRHLEIHGETIHTCTLCNKQFKIWHSYRKHMKIHNVIISRKQNEATTVQQVVEESFVDNEISLAANSPSSSDLNDHDDVPNEASLSKFSPKFDSVGPQPNFSDRNDASIFF